MNESSAVIIRLGKMCTAVTLLSVNGVNAYISFKTTVNNCYFALLHTLTKISNTLHLTLLCS